MSSNRRPGLTPRAAGYLYLQAVPPAYRDDAACEATVCFIPFPLSIFDPVPVSARARACLWRVSLSQSTPSCGNYFPFLKRQRAIPTGVFYLGGAGAGCGGIKTPSIGASVGLNSRLLRLSSSTRLCFFLGKRF